MKQGSFQCCTCARGLSGEAGLMRTLSSARHLLRTRDEVGLHRYGTVAWRGQATVWACQVVPPAGSHPPYPMTSPCCVATPGWLQSREILTATDAGHLPSDSTVGGRASHAPNPP